jgi:hypothetical protein
MRIALTICVAATLVAACGDVSDEPTATTVAVSEPTTSASTTSATGFDTLAATPPRAFDSFNATLSMAMTLGGIELEATSESTWTGDVFSCTITTGLGSMTTSESMIATVDTLWLDTGSGYEESDLLSRTAQDMTGLCPSAPSFWTNFSTNDLPEVSGPEELIDGRPAHKADISKHLVGLGNFSDLAGYEGATIHELIVWVDIETNTLIAMTADIVVPEEVVAESGTEGSGDVELVMEFAISDVNDPSLVVEVP